MPDRFETLALPSGRTIAYRGRLSDSTDRLILFIHGLGDDSTAWEEWTEDDDVFPGWDLFAIDLPGFGGTERTSNGRTVVSESLQTTLETISTLAPKEITLVLHSMGGVIGTLLAWDLLAALGTEVPRAWTHGGFIPESVPSESGVSFENAPKLKAVINIEGNITSADTFISSRAVNAEDNGRFDRWFSGLIESMIRTGEKSESRYASALLATDRRAFLTASRELVSWCEGAEGDECPAGEIYRALPVPTLYVGGSESLPKPSAEWLKQQGVEHVVVKGAGHAVMCDDPPAVAKAIQKLLK